MELSSVHFRACLDLFLSIRLESIANTSFEYIMSHKKITAEATLPFVYVLLEGA
jgi:hypothetical protein